jgi:AcrR family transcriptional regulator
MSPRRYSLGQRAPAVDLTRTRILAAAREVLEMHDRLSIDAVAQAADVARMTVYNQFGSRVGLLEALFDWLAVRGGIEALPSVFQQPDPDLALEAFIDTFCGFWASDRRVLRRLRALAALDADLAAPLYARDERRRAGLQVLLRRRAQQGPDALDILHTLTSFETFDALATDQRSPHEVAAMVLRVARAVVA